MAKNVTVEPKVVEVERNMLEKHGQDVLIVLHAAKKEKLEKAIEAAGAEYKKTQELVADRAKEQVESVHRQARVHYTASIKKLEQGFSEIPGCEVRAEARGELLMDNKGIRLRLMIYNKDHHGVTVSDVGAAPDTLVKTAIKDYEDAKAAQGAASEAYVKLQRELQALPRERERTEAKLALDRLRNSAEGSKLLERQAPAGLLS